MSITYRNVRLNPINCQNGRPTSGHCVECGRLANVANGGKRVTIPSQKNGVWVCNEHRGKRNLHGYSDENRIRVGKGNASNISISVELESMGISTAARAYLVDNNFLPTYDSTVDIEYKSPIYTSLLPLAKIVGGIEYFDKNIAYQFKVNHSDCGIHTHFGFIDNHYNFRNLDEHYEELFEKLAHTVEKELTGEQRKEIFGRDFQTYNDTIDFFDPYEHCNWINIQHEYSVEIRMPRFVTADKYMRFVNCFKDIFKALDTHYISKAHTDENAKKAGRKMDSIFRKRYKEYFTV